MTVSTAHQTQAPRRTRVHGFGMSLLLVWSAWIMVTLVSALSPSVLGLPDGSSIIMPWREHAIAELQRTCWWMVIAPATVWFIRLLWRTTGRLLVPVHVTGAALCIALTTALHLWIPIRYLGFGNISPGWMSIRLVLPTAVLAYAIALAAELFRRTIESQAWHARAASQHALQASQLQTQLSEAQLSALRMQLQPHFLFNALNGIAALGVSDPAESRRMISRLGDLLRQWLDAPYGELVPLSRELEWLEVYLELEQMRFGDRLHARFDVHPDVLGATVPHLLLQPVVENALHHGLDTAKGGTLVIRARRNCEETARLEIVVADDGRGLSALTAVEGFGLRNTRARLISRFREDYTLTVRASVAGGTETVIDVPFVTWFGPAEAILPVAV